MRPASLIGVLLLWPTLVLAQQQRPPQCTTADFHALDFWVGEWEVTDTTGRVIAESSIQRQAGGCAITEHWQPKGYPDGVSISWFDPVDQQWHQQWVGGGGEITRYTGGLIDSVMVMIGDAKQPSGVFFRMTWTRLPDGRVEQQQQTGKTHSGPWTTGFVGRYRKKG